MSASLAEPPPVVAGRRRCHGGPGGPRPVPPARGAGLCVERRCIGFSAIAGCAFDCASGPEGATATTEEINKCFQRKNVGLGSFVVWHSAL